MQPRRIFIAGGPRTGKTTLARELAAATGAPIVHTDDHIALGWSAASSHVATLMAAEGPLIVEGVAVPRALRKLLAARPDLTPCDRLIVLRAPHVALTPRQAGMTTGVLRVLRAITPALRQRGVEIVDADRERVSRRRTTTRRAR